MKKLITIVVIAMISVLSSQAVAVAARGERYPGKYYDFSATPELNLTEEQTQKLNALRDAHLREVKPLLEQMNNKRTELRRLWLERAPDRQNIENVQKEARILRDQLREKGSSYWIEAQKILTPEQQKKIQSYNSGRNYGSRSGYGAGRGNNRARGGWQSGY
jgi:Spy/CpxP family protein refolding chaperone